MYGLRKKQDFWSRAPSHLLSRPAHCTATREHLAKSSKLVCSPCHYPYLPKPPTTEPQKDFSLLALKKKEVTFRPLSLVSAFSCTFATAEIEIYSAGCVLLLGNVLVLTLLWELGCLKLGWMEFQELHMTQHHALEIGLYRSHTSLDHITVLFIRLVKMGFSLAKWWWYFIIYHHTGHIVMFIWPPCVTMLTYGHSFE